MFCRRRTCRFHTRQRNNDPLIIQVLTCGGGCRGLHSPSTARQTRQTRPSRWPQTSPAANPPPPLRAQTPTVIDVPGQQCWGGAHCGLQVRDGMYGQHTPHNLKMTRDFGNALESLATDVVCCKSATASASTTSLQTFSNIGQQCRSRVDVVLASRQGRIRPALLHCWRFPEVDESPWMHPAEVTGRHKPKVVQFAVVDS